MERIYISVIEGTEYFAPVNAMRLPSGDFEIVDDDLYDSSDGTVLPEFLRGDVVKAESKEGKLYATELVTSSTPERKYFEIRRRILLENLPMNQETVAQYLPEVQRLLREYDSHEKSFHPAVRSWLEKYSASLAK